MDTTRAALLTLLFAAPAAAQTRGRAAAPAVPVVGGPALTAAAVGGLRAPSLAAPSLPNLPAPSVSPVLPAAASILPRGAAPGPRADAPAMPVPGVRAWPREIGVGLAAPAQANGVAEKPSLASLEAAAKPFSDDIGRAAPQAAAQLGLTFDASLLARADEAAAVIPGVRNWPRVAGVGLARPFNGVSEEKKPEAPAPKKADPEKPMGKWEAIGTGLLLAALLAGSLFLWYQLYASMGQVMQMGEQQLYQQYHGPVGGWEDLFR